MPGRRRVLFRRRGERRGVSLPSRSLMISEWKSLSSKEREERRRLVVEKYYHGDFSAFKKDAEKSPFKVLALMFTVKPAEAVKPVVKKAEAKLRVEPKPKPEEKPAPSAEEKATLPAKAEPAKKLSEDESRRLYMLEKWLERLRKTGARDPRDPFKSLPSDHPLTVLQARKVEAQIRQLKGEITDEEYRRTVEKLNEEIKKVEKELESEKPKHEEKKAEAPTAESEFEKWRVELSNLAGKWSELAIRHNSIKESIASEGLTPEWKRQLDALYRDFSELDRRYEDLLRKADELNRLAEEQNADHIKRKVSSELTLAGPIRRNIRERMKAVEELSKPPEKHEALTAEVKHEEKRPVEEAPTAKKPLTEEALLGVLGKYLDKPFVGVRQKDIADILEKEGYSTENLYNVIRSLEGKKKLIWLGLYGGLDVVYALAEVNPAMDKDEMEPRFYAGFTTFKVKTEYADQVRKELEQVKAPDENIRDLYELEMYEHRGPRVTEFSIQPKLRAMTSNMDFRVENYVKNQARLMGKEIFNIMKKYGATVKDYESRRMVPVEEYERRQLAKEGKAPKEAVVRYEAEQVEEEPEASTVEAKPAEKTEAPAVEKTPEAKTKPEIGYFVFLSPEELSLLSDEELESYRKMMEERFWSHYKELDDEGAEKYRNEVDIILKEKGRRFTENARREILDVLAVDTSGMTLEELEDYRRRIDQIERKYPFPPKELVEDMRKLIEKRSEVGGRIRELEESWKASLVEKAKAGTLTYAETPDDNPFTLSWSSSPTEKERLETQNWELLAPYVAAKERTKQVVEIMKGLGEEPDVEKIFQDYVEFQKSPPDDRRFEKDPYRKYWELNAKSHDLIPKVESLIMKRLVLAGDAQPITLIEELPEEERDAARLAVVKWLAKEARDFRVKDFRTGRIKKLEELELKDWILPPEGWEVVNIYIEGFETKKSKLVSGKAISVLSKMAEQPIVTVDGDKGYVHQLNEQHTTMFRGTIDLSDLNLKPGHYRVAVNGSYSLLKNPDAIVKTGENTYAFVKFKDKGVDMCHVEFERLEEPPEEKPEIKVQFDGYAVLSAKTLKSLLRDGGHSELLRITAEGGDFKMEHVNQHNEVIRALGKRELEDATIETHSSRSKSHYDIGYLKDLISELSPSATLTIRWAQDKPMKIEVEDEKTGIKGEYWVAPYVEG